MNIINRKPGETFLIIRENYVSLCNGNVVAAALIHIFEQWHVNKVRTKKQMSEKSVEASVSAQQKVLIDGLYQWHTTADLESYLMGIGKKDAILAARRQLESMGIITEHRNPNSKLDNTTFFIFHPDQLNELLEIRKSPEINRHCDEVKSPAPKAEPSSENRQYNKDSLIDSNIEILVDADASTAKPKPINKKKEPDPNWAQWVDAWFVFFKSRNDGREPVFNGSQQKALKDLRKYLVKISADGVSDQDAAGLGTLEAIFASWDKLDQWQRTQFDLTVILKKINEFINRIKNGPETNRLTDQSKSGISQSREQALRDY